MERLIKQDKYGHDRYIDIKVEDLKDGTADIVKTSGIVGSDKFSESRTNVKTRCGCGSPTPHGTSSRFRKMWPMRSKICRSVEVASGPCASKSRSDRAPGEHRSFPARS